MTKNPINERKYLLTVIAPAFQALGTYWPAILLIQGIALTIVLSYYNIEGTQNIFARIAALKLELGLSFAAISTVFSGGIIPELVKRIFRPKGIAQPNSRELIHQFIMWAWVGILVDRFYLIQNKLFGDGKDFTTLAIKMLVD